jgi:23S rRNA (adenine2503-C2)-methyltransferase
VEGLEWSRPSRARQQRFHSIVREHGVISTLRLEKGHDIAAACGQLRLQTKREYAGAPAALMPTVSA